MPTLSTQIMAALATWYPDGEDAPETVRSPKSGPVSTRKLRPFRVERTTVWAYSWDEASELYHG